jgi:hypothetical protein
LPPLTKIPPYVDGTPINSASHFTVLLFDLRCHRAQNISAYILG